MTMPSPGQREAAYDVIAMGNLWAFLSIVLALLGVYSRRWLAFLPWQLQGYYLWPPVAVLVVPPLAALGVLSGRIAVRRDPKTFVGRLGFWLNLVILGLSSLVVLAAWLYRAVS